MRVAFLTVGNPERRTGGYLYHARVFGELRAAGVTIDEIKASHDPDFDAQRLEAPLLGAAVTQRLADADVVMIDALACVACAPWISDWQQARPVVAMVHELPSVAAGGGEAATAVTNDVLVAEERLLRADQLIAVSRHGADILQSHGVAPERITIAMPGCDRLALTPPPPPAATSQQTIRAICVAQWIPRKGIDTLVTAWTRRQLGARLDLIGEIDADPAYRERVVRHIAQHPNAGITVRGPIDDDALADAYRRADFFVLPTRYEGYGMVFAEALLHGLPVVATTVGPIPELVGPDAGLLVPPDDPPAIADALDRMISDAALRHSLADGARRRGKNLPTWRDTTDAVQRALTTAIAERTARPPVT